MENAASKMMREYVNSQKFNSTTEIMEAMKDLFRDALQQVMEGELEESLGYEKSGRMSEIEESVHMIGGFSSITINGEKSVKKIYYAKISDIIILDRFNQLLTLVIKEKQEQIKQFHFDIDKKLSLYSKTLIRIIICKELNINNKAIVFEKNKYGKTHLKATPNLHFNLSHTRNAVVVAVLDEPVGVDIEKVKTSDLQIAKRFFSDSEFTYITKSDVGIDNRFYEIWTKKEAYIKYIGKGLYLPLNSFDVLDTVISRRIRTFQKDDCVIPVCSERSNQVFDIIELSENDIEDMCNEFST